MGQTWTSRRRLLAALACEVPDRVPICTYELVGHNSHAWENREPSYARLMERIRSECDCAAMWDPGSNQRFLCSAYQTPLDSQQELRGGFTRTTTILHTRSEEHTSELQSLS
jgi:hypothetical protein